MRPTRNRPPLLPAPATPSRRVSASSSAPCATCSAGAAGVPAARGPSSLAAARSPSPRAPKKRRCGFPDPALPARRRPAHAHPLSQHRVLTIIYSPGSLHVEPVPARCASRRPSSHLSREDSAALAYPPRFCPPAYYQCQQSSTSSTIHPARVPYLTQGQLLAACDQTSLMQAEQYGNQTCYKNGPSLLVPETSS